MSNILNKQTITSKDTDKYNLVYSKDVPLITQEEKDTQRQLCTLFKNGSNIIIPLWLESKGRCTYCSAKLTPDSYTLDHIIPISKGGITSFDNLCVCCNWCNTLKGNLYPEDFRKQLKQYSKDLYNKHK